MRPQISCTQAEELCKGYEHFSVLVWEWVLKQPKPLQWGVFDFEREIARRYDLKLINHLTNKLNELHGSITSRGVGEYNNIREEELPGIKHFKMPFKYFKPIRVFSPELDGRYLKYREVVSIKKLTDGRYQVNFTETPFYNSVSSR